MRSRFATAQTGVTQRRIAVVAVSSEQATGWGEAAPVPGHTVQPFAQVWTDLRTAAKALFGGDMPESDGVATAALHQAIDDLAAKERAQPLRAYLGATNPVVASAAIGLDSGATTPDSNTLRTARDQGYRAAKLKITASTELGDLADIKDEHPQMLLGLDANGALPDWEGDRWDALDDLGFAYLEQPGPIDDLAWHAELSARMNTPIVLDESARDWECIEQILRVRAADAINIKAGRFGSRNALTLANRISEQGIAVRVGGFVESGIGRAHSIALAGCAVFTITGDVAASDLYFVDDLVTPSWQLTDGLLVSPDAAGIGVDVDEAAVASLAFDRFSLM